MRFVEFEGTPAEFEAVKHHFAVGSSGGAVKVIVDAPAPEVPGSPASATGKEAEMIEKVLTRRPLPETVSTILVALLEARDGLTTKQLAKQAGISRKQFSGVMGSFGRRVSHTKGWPDALSLVDEFWNEEGERVYRLTSVAREVLLSGRVKLK